jgi:energy-coupling factor transport system permease protein
MDNFVLVLIVNLVIVIALGFLTMRFEKEPIRNTGSEIPWKWTVRDVVIAAVLAAVSGVLLTGESYLYQISLAIGGPLGSAIMTGAFSWPYILAFMLIRKPFACIFIAVLATTVQALLGNPAGIYTLGWGITQGLSCEAILGFTRWNNNNKKVYWIAGAVSAQFGTVWSWYLYGWSNTMELYWLSILITLIAGGFLSGFLGYYIGKRLLMSGLLRTGGLKSI